MALTYIVNAITKHRFMRHDKVSTLLVSKYVPAETSYIYLNNRRCIKISSVYDARCTSVNKRHSAFIYYKY